jgi:hypothetical protein
LVKPTGDGTFNTIHAILQREQAFRRVAGVDRHVLAETERAELIDPGVIAAFHAAAVLHTAELRQRLGVERPSLGAVLAGCRRSVEHLALASIEAREVTAGERAQTTPFQSMSMPRGDTRDGASRCQSAVLHFRECGLRRPAPGTRRTIAPGN